MSCQRNSTKMEAFTTLTLRLPSDLSCTLKDCLDFFGAREDLTTREFANCIHCTSKTVNKRNIEVHSWRKVLILHLSRFEARSNERGEYVESDRKDTLVSFPLTELNVGSLSNPILYDCVAICNHFGTRHGGHYTAHAIRGDTWFHFNDDKKPEVVQSPQDRIGEANKNAYMLFYVRRAPILTASV